MTYKFLQCHLRKLQIAKLLADFWQCRHRIFRLQDTKNNSKRRIAFLFSGENQIKTIKRPQGANFSDPKLRINN